LAGAALADSAPSVKSNHTPTEPRCAAASIAMTFVHSAPVTFASAYCPFWAGRALPVAAQNDAAVSPEPEHRTGDMRPSTPP
jgi:hypothetical protein